MLVLAIIGIALAVVVLSTIGLLIDAERKREDSGLTHDNDNSPIRMSSCWTSPGRITGRR